MTGSQGVVRKEKGHPPVSLDGNYWGKKRFEKGTNFKGGPKKVKAPLITSGADPRNRYSSLPCGSEKCRREMRVDVGGARNDCATWLQKEKGGRDSNEGGGNSVKKGMLKERGL